MSGCFEQGSQLGRQAPGFNQESATVQQVSDSLQLMIRFEPGEDGWIIASIPGVSGALSPRPNARGGQSERD